MPNPNYRLYLLDAHGRIAQRIDLDPEEELAALAEASRLAGDKSAELWNGTKLIARLGPILGSPTA